MADDLDKEKNPPMDEAEFEASLVSDVDAGLVEAETRIVESKPPPPPQPQPPQPTKKLAQPAWVGKVLGHFKLLRLIGEGKMGRVIQAQDINLQRLVALKILGKRMKGISANRRVNQFLREARAAAQIEHPNVIRIYEINQHDGWWYIAMEMLDGGNLREVVKAAGPLSVPRACAFIADAASALTVAHQLGIIHRDVKPANLMLTRHGRCKVTDFGLVRLDDPDDPFDFTHNAVGSPLFMAPEMILRREQTPAIDIYSLGTTLYYALLGRAPYTGKTIEEVLRKHVQAKIPDLRTLLPNCPPTLATLLQRAMAKDPAQRPSAADMASALRAEVIATQAGDSVMSGSGALSLSGTTVLAPGSSVQKTPGPVCIRFRDFLSKHRYAAISIVGVIVLLCLFGLGKRLLFPTGPRPGRLAHYFPGAPETYGILPPKTILKPVSPSTDDLPKFSWFGKIDTTGFKFAASNTGRFFYPIDAPQALLIRREDFVGYKTSEEAAADGKAPAK